MQITLTAKDLAALLRPVLPHVDKGDTLPLLAAVLLTSESGRMIAAATDRYTLGVQRVKVEGVKPGLRALVPADAAKTLLKMFRVTRAYNPELTLTFEDYKVTVEASGFALDGLSEARVAFHLQAGDYPDLTGIITPVVTAEARAGTAPLNPTLLSRFTAAQTSGEPMMVAFGGEKPTHVRVGDDFIGLIMPMRAAGSDAHPEPWESAIATLAAPERPARKRTRRASREAVSA